jgi:serine/threonine protein kinase
MLLYHLCETFMIALKSISNSAQESQPLVADKKLLSPDEMEFLKEKTILNALGLQNHPNLIQLLASYQKEKWYHFLFPCADCNLTTYWKKNAVPNFDKETVLWSIRQMSGIASALDCIHTFRVKVSLNVEGEVRILEGGVKLCVEAGEEKYGRHGDIKPENILWFKDGKVLKITDFGLGRFHGRDSRSGIDGRRVFGTLTYEPPECSLGRLVSRKYDIWSLGCLFLEFVTWLLEGSAKIGEFSNARGLDTGFVNDDTFFTVFTDEDHEKDAEIRVAVIGWVNRLHFNENCSALIHDLLDLVMGSMLRIDPGKRKTAQQLKNEMELLVAGAENCDSYLINGDPRSLPLRTPPDVQKTSTSQKEVHWADELTSATAKASP